MCVLTVVLINEKLQNCSFLPSFSFEFSGTYNPITGLDEDTDCLPCAAGMFCNETGLADPSGECSAGYICISGAAHPGPDDGVNGPCPVGHYCLQGELSSLAVLRTMRM